MKDQVPVVLLNQWLDVEQEKSGFAKRENWVLDADEYSVYSGSTISKALSVHGSSFAKSSKFAKRNSVFQAVEKKKSNFEYSPKHNSNRRMTIKVN